MIPTTINTNERIFKVIDFDGNNYLCNLNHFDINKLDEIKKLQHYWNFKFIPFAKIDLKNMILISKK